jgi:hypothetical protein
MENNQSAWPYLVLACKDEAINIMARVNDDNVFQAWNRLKQVFAPNRSKDLVRMDMDFNDASALRE